MRAAATAGTVLLGLSTSGFVDNLEFDDEYEEVDLLETFDF